MEYIVNEDLTWEVLTNDDVFSFREGYAKVVGCISHYPLSIID